MGTWLEDYHKLSRWERGLGNDTLVEGDWVEVCTHWARREDRREYGYVTGVRECDWVPEGRRASGVRMPCDFDFMVYVPLTKQTGCFRSSSYLRKLDVLEVLALPDKHYYPWEPPPFMWVFMSGTIGAARDHKPIENHPYYSTFTIVG